MKYIFLIFCLFLSACGGSDKSNSGLTPMPERKDLKDEELFEAVADFITLQEAPPNSTYDFVRVDLNGDGRREGIVLFKLPHTHWCGWDGCGMAIFKAHNDRFTLLSTMSNVRGPIYIAATGNKGWRDIIIRTSGTKMPDRDVRMFYSNGKYPQSPLLAPSLGVPLSSIPTEVFFR